MRLYLKTLIAFALAIILGVFLIALTGSPVIGIAIVFVATWLYFYREAVRLRDPR